MDEVDSETVVVETFESLACRVEVVEEVLSAVVDVVDVWFWGACVVVVVSFSVGVWVVDEEAGIGSVDGVVDDVFASAGVAVVFAVIVEEVVVGCVDVDVSVISSVCCVVVVVDDEVDAVSGGLVVFEFWVVCGVSSESVVDAGASVDWVVVGSSGVVVVSWVVDVSGVVDVVCSGGVCVVVCSWVVDVASVVVGAGSWVVVGAREVVSSCCWEDAESKSIFDSFPNVIHEKERERISNTKNTVAYLLQPTVSPRFEVHEGVLCVLNNPLFFKQERI